MSFSESLDFEIATTQAQLDAIETERKKLKKKLKSLNAFLEEFNHASEIVEAENKEDLPNE